MNQMEVIENGTYVNIKASIEPFTIIKKGTIVRKLARVSSCVRIEEDCYIGDNTFIGHGVVMRPKTIIESDCVIGHLTVFEGGSKVGKGTLIQAQSNITRGAVIGDKVFIGMQFCGGNDIAIIHERWDHCGEFEPDPYIIEDFARIGFGVHVLPGVVIGKNSFVAAGSLVTRSIPDNAKVKGRPAKVYGEVEKEYIL